MSHHCHAKGCTVPVPPKMLMCRRHWFMVPPDLRAAVWDEYHHSGDAAGRDRRLAEYREGGGPYMHAAELAIAAVAAKEGR